MDSIGWIEKCPKHTSKIHLVMFYWKKLMVYNGTLMETIGIYVMMSIGLLLFFLYIFVEFKIKIHIRMKNIAFEF